MNDLTNIDTSIIINDIFVKLADYLNTNKEILNHLTGEPLNQDVVNLLSLNKQVLERIKNKLDPYKADLESSIQHTNEVLANANSNSTGGKRHKRKTRKTRKMKSNRKKY